MRPNLIPITVLAAGLLIAPAAAQEGSALVVRTTQDELAYNLLDMFESDADLPEAGGDVHWVLSLDDGGRMQVQTGQGEVGLVRIAARPATLMEMFADEIAGARSQIAGFASLGLGQTGLQPRDIQTIIKAVFEFPAQIERLTVAVDGDPQIPEDGFKAAIDMFPVQGSWLAGFVGSLESAPAGAPVLSDPSWMLRGAMAMKIADPKKVLAPLMQFAARALGKGKEQREQFSELWDGLLDSFGFSGAFSWSMEGNGMLTVNDLDDAGRYAEVVAGDAYKEWVERSQVMAMGADVEYEPGAFEHRGAKLDRVTVTVPDSPAGPNPLTDEDGKMVQLTGQVGRYLVSATSAPESEIKGLIDRILDDKIERAPVKNGKLVRFDLKLADFLDVMTNGMVPVDSLPELVTFELGRAKGALQIGVDVR